MTTADTRRPLWRRTWVRVTGSIAALALVGGAGAAGATLAGSHPATVYRPAANAAPVTPKATTPAPKAAPASPAPRPSSSGGQTIIINNNPPAAQAPTTIVTNPPAAQCYDQGVAVSCADYGTADKAIVEQYYRYLNAKDFSDAWNMGGYNIAGGAGYSAWVAGYAHTTSTYITSDWYEGDGWVGVNVTATTDYGTVQHYTGEYQVGGGVVASGQLTQTS